MLRLVSLATTASVPTCDYRIVEESKYSNFSGLAGLSTNTSICMNSYYSAEDSNMTLQQFLDVPNATILNDALAITRRTLGGARASGVSANLRWSAGRI